MLVWYQPCAEFGRKATFRYKGGNESEEQNCYSCQVMADFDLPNPM